MKTKYYQYFMSMILFVFGSGTIFLGVSEPSLFLIIIGMILIVFSVWVFPHKRYSDMRGKKS